MAFSTPAHGSSSSSAFVVDPRVLLCVRLQEWCVAGLSSGSKSHVARSIQSGSSGSALGPSHVLVAMAISCHIRHTFCGPAHSRGDQSDHVRWSFDGNSCISQQEVLDNWRRHFASVGASSSSLGSFGEDFHAVVSARFLTVRSVCAQGSGLFDAPFSASEVRHALTFCSDSTVGLDGLPHSLLKLNFPWWQDALLAFFNLVFSWSVVPTVWKRSIIVPVFKRGDPTLPNNYRPISLASCFFKILEHLVHSRIAPHIIPQLDDSQSGFCWGADVLVGSLVSILSARSSSHTLVAFIDIQKAFDTSWVEGTLVRLFDAGVRGRMWTFMCNFLHGTQSQVRCGSSLSEPWVDSGIVKGESSLHSFSTSSSTALLRLCDKLPLVCSSVPRPYVFQVSCMPMVLSCLPNASFDLQVALDAVARWGRQWRFSFGIGPTKSAVMVFGPRRSIPPCSVHLGGDPLPIVMAYPYLGVILTPTLSWTAHARHLVTSGIDPSPNVLHGAKLKGSPCALLPPCSPPTCCPASPGGLSSSSLVLCPPGDRLCSAPLAQIPSGMAL